MRLVLTVSRSISNEAIDLPSAAVEAATSGCAEHGEGHALPPKCSKEAASVARCDMKVVLPFRTAAFEPKTTAAEELQGTPIYDELHRRIELLRRVIVSIGDTRITPRVAKVANKSDIIAVAKADD